MELEAEIIDTASRKHNLIILGQAGTGKTELIKKLSGILVRKGNIVKKTASTGIAASLLQGTTVHRFTAIKDGRFTDTEILDKVNNDIEYGDVKKNLLLTDTLIIDVISMISWKTFVQIENLIRKIRQINTPFGGMQVILSGDFFQLKPVPNPSYNDKGEVLTTYKRLTDLIPHKFILTKVHRQEEAILIKAVHELSRGTTSAMTDELMYSLQKALPENSNPVKLFALNYDVDKCNSDHLMDMPGDLSTYMSIDSGNLKAMKQCPAPDILYLKKEAAVMLIVNISDNLVNGLQGTVKDLKKGSVTVYFHTLQRREDLCYHTFPLYDSILKKDIAVRKQIPLRLAFSLTVHKAQGLSLDCAQVDCRNMYQPGQIGVAVGRVRSMNGLRVVNYRPGLVRPQPTSITDYYALPSIPVQDDRSCCETTQENTSVDSDGRDTSSIEMETMEFGDEAEFDSETDTVLMNLITEHLDKEHPEPEQAYPQSIQTSACLKSLKYDQPVTETQRLLNEIINYLEINQSATINFFNTVWAKMKEFFDNCIPSGEDTKVENKHVTAYYKEISTFMTSEAYKLSVAELFQTIEIADCQYRVAYGLIDFIKKKVLEKAVEPMLIKAKEEAKKPGKVFPGSEVGRSKIRYIAGWCIATLKYGKKQMVRKNLYKKSTRLIVDKADKEVRLLEKLTVSEDEIFNTTTDIPSLMEIKRKQNLRGGLCNISDNCFSFFAELYTELRKLESIENLNLYGKHFYSFISSEISNNQQLRNKWNSMFDDSDCSIEIVQNLLNEVISKYLKMSSNQFRKEFKATQGVQKQMAHRKQIQVSKTKSESQWSVSNIYNDASDNKGASHRRLQSELAANSLFLETSFKKKDLNNLCAAYCVTVSKKMAKLDLVEALKPVIISSEQMKKPMKMSRHESDSKTPMSEEPKTSIQEGIMQPIPSTSGEPLHATTGQGDISKHKESVFKSKKRKLPSSKKGKVPLKKSYITVKWPCGMCEKECKEQCVACDRCDTWFHFTCLAIDQDDDSLSEDEWHCPHCVLELSTE